jgi:hypothetical protein
MKPGSLARFAASVFLAGPLALLVGCSPSYTDYYFDGRVYNGVDGSRLVDYDIQLQFLDRELDGNVDDDGRYFLGPLTPFNDYTIAIEADGYRTFLSHNVMKLNDELTNNNNPSDDNQHPDQSQYFDAYLFPVSVVSPAATIHITLSDSMDTPSGTIRFRPTTSSALIAGPINMPAGVGGQVWLNDDDLQFASVSRDFMNGEVDLAAGDLVFGVTYEVTIYNVVGHSVTTATYTAGFDGDAAFVVNPLGTTALALSFVSTQLGQPAPDGKLVFIVNQPVILDPLTAPDTQLRSLEANFTIDSPDANMDGNTNTLKPFDPMAAAGSRGLALTVMGDQITITWNPATALQSTDTADPIKSVTYGGLAGVILRPINGTAADSATLAALLGSPSITVPVTP